MATSTAAARELRGSCNCGRNTYVIDVPPNTDAPSVKEVVRVVWDGSQPPHLRIPLPWYHSTTYGFFPDETHSAIHRIYHASSPSGQRHFCGYCGASVSHWLEGDKEREWMYVDLRTLGGESLVWLEGLRVPGEEGEAVASAGETLDQENDGEKGEDEMRVVRGGDGHIDWFERIVTSSGGGKVRVSRGARQEGGARVEWEIVEWTGDDSSATTETPGKRKLGAVQADEAMEE